MSIHIGDESETMGFRLRTVTFSPPVHATCTGSSTLLVLHAEEWDALCREVDLQRTLEREQAAERDEEEAWQTGDHVSEYTIGEETAYVFRETKI